MSYGKSHLCHVLPLLLFTLVSVSDTLRELVHVFSNCYVKVRV